MEISKMTSKRFLIFPANKTFRQRDEKFIQYFTKEFGNENGDRNLSDIKWNAVKILQKFNLRYALNVLCLVKVDNKI